MSRFTTVSGLGKHVNKINQFQRTNVFQPIQFNSNHLKQKKWKQSHTSLGKSQVWKHTHLN